MGLHVNFARERGAQDVLCPGLWGLAEVGQYSLVLSAAQPSPAHAEHLARVSGSRM